MEKYNKPVKRREVLKYTTGTLVATTGIGMVSAKPSKDEEKKVKKLLKALQNADDKEEYYASLSHREKELVKSGLTLNLDNISSVTTSNKNTNHNSSPAPQATTTYTHRHRIEVPNNLGQTILTYIHTLHWEVDLGPNEITSVNVETSGSGKLFWVYEKDIDPQYKTVQPDGCHSKRSGLFRYCNKLEGFEYCTKELRTKITSDISGFPNSSHNTAKNVVQCGTNC
ncbi:hypothetical protein [Halocatena marina]|uniref:hypothetical protein n=1 Tax=Halocatena marina TaxID=2934937 RepID=UPI0022256A5A|nr:hypothetical protein [Halocatena marina]